MGKSRDQCPSEGGGRSDLTSKVHTMCLCHRQSGMVLVGEEGVGSVGS